MILEGSSRLPGKRSAAMAARERNFWNMDESKLREKGFEKLFQKKTKPEFYAALQKALGEKRFGDREAIYEAGDDSSDGLYLIINGKVRLRNPETGDEAIRAEGDVFGVSGILRTRGKREETVLSSGDTLLAVLSREDAERLAEENPGFDRWIERCLLFFEEEKRRADETDREKRRIGAKAVFLALLPMAWAVVWDALVTKFAGENALSPLALMVLFLGTAALIAVFFLAGKFPKGELGFGKPVKTRTFLISLAAVAELSALYFLAAMAEDNGVISGFAAPGGGSVTGGGALLFFGMSLFHLAVFFMTAGILPRAAEALFGGKSGKIAKWLLPLAVAAPVYAALEGAEGAVWLLILTLTFLFVRIRTGDLFWSGAFFFVASAVGAFGFGILFVPAMF